MEFSKTFSLTFGDVAENHRGMQKIGHIADNGFSLHDLNTAKTWFEDKGCKCKIINLHWLLPEQLQVQDNFAWILTVKDAVNALLQNDNGADLLYAEQDILQKDTKAIMYGRVVNKHARHNLCFADLPQLPDYDNGKGTVYAFNDLPYLNLIRSQLHSVLGNIAHNLPAEGNYYYDLNKCGIGYHGDAERKKVIAFRLGATIPLHYRWYHDNTVVSDTFPIHNLQHGDMYIMSQKTTGYDWKSKSKYTLRHAAGSHKYLI
jgi:hypothetical protein